MTLIKAINSAALVIINEHLEPCLSNPMGKAIVHHCWGPGAAQTTPAMSQQAIGH